MKDAGSVPQGDPIAYFLTWPTYGTWLPGDDRGWVKKHRGLQPPNWKVEHEARRKLTEAACTLTDEQRALVEDTIRSHCKIRRWALWAVACRTNHVHVVVSAPVGPEKVIAELKVWCTRRLKEQDRCIARTKWWAECGSRRYLNDESSLEAAVTYVRECQ